MSGHSQLKSSLLSDVFLTKGKQLMPHLVAMVMGKTPFGSDGPNKLLSTVRDQILKMMDS